MRVSYIGYDPCSPILLYLAGRPDVRLVRVVTAAEGWGDHIWRIAAGAGVPVQTTRADAADMQRMAADSDLVLCACYDYRLPIPFGTSCRFINVHPTLLPLGRGPTPVQYILRGQTEAAGVTLHLMTAVLDGGPIVAQAPLPVSPGDSYESYMHRANRAAIALLAGIDAAGLAGLPARPQQGRSSYDKQMPEAQRTITPAMTAAEIVSLVASMGPLRAIVAIDGVRYAVSHAQAYPGPADGPAFANWLYGHYPCRDGYCLFPYGSLTMLLPG